MARAQAQANKKEGHLLVKLLWFKKQALTPTYTTRKEEATKAA